MAQAHPKNGSHRATLRDDRHACSRLERRHRRDDEGERDAVNVVRDSEAVRPLDDHVVFACDFCEMLLFDAALLASLRKACGEDDDAANLAAGAGQYRFHYGSARDREHRAVDTLGQVVDGRHAGPSADLRPLRVDEVQGTVVACVVEVGEDTRAEGSGCG